MFIDPVEPKMNPLEKVADGQNAEARLQKLRTTSVDFEAMLIHQMFEAMEKTLQDGNMVGQGVSGSIYSGILSEAVSKNMAQSQSLGLAEQLYQDVIRHDPELKRLVEKLALEASGKKVPSSEEEEKTDSKTPSKMSDPQSNMPISSLSPS